MQEASHQGTGSLEIFQGGSKVKWTGTASDNATIKMFETPNSFKIKVNGIDYGDYCLKVIYSNDGTVKIKLHAVNLQCSEHDFRPLVVLVQVDVIREVECLWSKNFKIFLSEVMRKDSEGKCCFSLCFVQACKHCRTGDYSWLQFFTI